MTALKTKNNMEKPAELAAIKTDAVLIQGDLSTLSEDQRSAYYLKVCDSLGLNPHTQPFEYIPLGGKLKLYATRACSDQLRKLHGVSIQILSRELVEDIYTVTARAEDMTGRTDESCGVVSLKGLMGEARSNKIMCAETKAKRRVTLSICGLGWLDETEVEPQLQLQTRIAVPALAAPVVVDEHKPMETFHDLCNAVEHAFPGTMQGMLKHYKVSSVDQLVEAQRIDAEKLIAKKMGGAK
ncbi:hypothetical protein UFOVP1565_5 [uncultured Caudovirales phage]|uniref:Uncharacterized protein n=1 Tax=uncultured Caudovirales phage TaxID=2100421 RepID=A0A6J5LXP4_9CAUD|nr:hypothetical protein UFOVP311_21 [uncultured Caudovirales phage]CAB4204206.1 hypothetical protein UFOVP1388_42 [uncultured Caudovirales phage]CAB5229638.1 hypothetical protein UFOVP1565_5 [uncultured Caudovirales phage]